MSDDLNAVITWIDEPTSLRAGPLRNRRLLVKDLIDVEGVPATYGSRIYADHIPDRSAPAVARLVEAGAVVVGKANLPEFAWNVTGQNPWYGTTHNPVYPGKSTGGSSSGNAAALAAGLCDLGLGTDTGCSIRLPSACCGTIGLKPRWGGIPMSGIHPLVPTLDTVGPMAKSVADVALAWSVLVRRPVPEPRLEGLTVGVLTRPGPIGDGRAAAESTLAEEWVPALLTLGAKVVRAAIPPPEANTWPVFFREALQSHARTWPVRAADYSENVRAKLELAEQVRDDEVARAYRALERWRRFEPEVDLYVAPCVAAEPPPEECDEFDVRLWFSEWLRWVNLIGWAALAIGNLQLVGPTDEMVLAAGLAWERQEGGAVPLAL